MGCQGVLGIGRVTFHIPNSLVPSGSGDFFGRCLIVRYPSLWHPWKWWGLRLFSGGLWYRYCHYFMQGSDLPELIVPNIKGIQWRWIFNHLSQILNCAVGGVGGGRTWYGAVMWGWFYFSHSFGACLWDIHGVSSVVLWVWAELPALHYLMVKCAPIAWPLKNKDFDSGSQQRG